ncbi:MAG: hypothetical protein R3Y09_06615 [Clostridia bacterium]
MNSINEKLQKIESELSPIPYIVHESEMARTERREKRHFFVTLLLTVLLVASNFLWMQYEMSFEDSIVTETTTYTSDTGDGNGNAVINEDGEVNFDGKSDQDSNQNNQN